MPFLIIMQLSFLTNAASTIQHVKDIALVTQSLLGLVVMKLMMV